jgi:hypothetical protein
MKAFKLIQSLLVILSILGLALLLAEISSSRMGDPVSQVLIIVLIIWGFRLRRKLNKKNETDEDAFLWLKVIIYTCLIIFPVASKVTHHFDLPDTFEPALITTYIVFPFLGASLAALRLRHDLKETETQPVGAGQPDNPPVKL